MKEANGTGRKNVGMAPKRTASFLTGGRKEKTHPGTDGHPGTVLAHPEAHFSLPHTPYGVFAFPPISAGAVALCSVVTLASSPSISVCCPSQTVALCLSVPLHKAS